jgi:3-phosphoshikimate 1-carboxyvinyltransferase
MAWRRARIGGVGLRAPRPAAIDVGNAGTLLRLLPGWLAGQERASWSSTATTRSGAAGRPDRRAAARDGRRPRLPRGRLPPLEIEGAPLHGSSTSCRSPAPRSSPACSSPGSWPRGDPVVEPAPSRDHTERMLAAAGAE